MANAESHGYRPMIAEVIDSPPGSSPRWYKLAMMPLALIGGSCLLLVCITATGTSRSRNDVTSISGSSNFAGVSLVSRSLFGGPTVDKMEGDKKRMVVVGATGHFGVGTMKAGLRMGFEMVGISRGRSENNSEVIDSLEKAGGKFVFIAMDDIKALVAVMNGADVVALFPPAPLILQHCTLAIDAAKAAGIKRIMLTPDGIDPEKVPAKGLLGLKVQIKRMVAAAGMEHTQIFLGGIAEWMLPNMRSGNPIKHGSGNVRFASHTAADTGIVYCRAAFDPRAAGKAVLMTWNIGTEQKAIDIMDRIYPDVADKVVEMSEEQIREMAKDGQPGHDVLKYFYLDAMCDYTSEHFRKGADYYVDVQNLYPDLKSIDTWEKLYENPEWFYGAHDVQGSKSIA